MGAGGDVRWFFNIFKLFDQLRTPPDSNHDVMRSLGPMLGPGWACSSVAPAPRLHWGSLHLAVGSGLCCRQDQEGTVLPTQPPRGGEPVARQLPRRQHHGYPCSRPIGVCTNMTCCCVDHNKTEAIQRQDSDISSSPAGPYTPLSSWPCPCWRSATPPKRKCPLGRPGNRPPLGSRMVTELPTHRRSSIR